MPPAGRSSTQERWQLAMFRKGLKKRLRYRHLRKLLGRIEKDERCLLLTCGDNNGAMNFYLRELGGRWSWADLEETCLREMSELLGEPVVLAGEDRLPFPDGAFSRVIAIDVHEHVEDPRIVNAELARVLASGGQMIITTPNGDESKLAVRIKHAVGMAKEVYGHRRIGLTAGEIEALMLGDSVRPVRTTTFSRFFTEILELTINFAYVKVLSRKDRDPGGHAEIAPSTSDQLRSVRKSYLLYSAIFPVYWLVSQLDHLIFFTEGYCVMVEGRNSS